MMEKQGVVAGEGEAPKPQENQKTAGACGDGSGSGDGCGGDTLSKAAEVAKEATKEGCCGK